MSSWERTSKSYVSWLCNTDLRKEFAKNIRYQGLSLWWLNKLLDKDNLNETKWYEDLHHLLNKKKAKIIKKDKLFYIKFFIKFFKKFVAEIVFTVFVKIFFESKNKNLTRKKNCFYAVLSNFVVFEDKFIDRQYGLAGLKKTIKQMYFIEFTKNFRIITKYFDLKKKLKNIPFDFFISSHHLNVLDIIKIYWFSLKMFFLTIIILRKKNFFYINKINCKEILKFKLLESFSGSVQDQLLKGLALEKGLSKTDCQNFINCFDFHPHSRPIYYFARQSKVKNIISINHANYSENNLFFNFNKKEFSENNGSPYFSPKPDIFFCQGKRYYKKLKKIFLREKIYNIGSLKIELNKFELKYYKIKKNRKRKKILLILCSMNDYSSFVKLLNQCNLENFNIIVAPHPLNKISTINYFEKNFKKEFLSNEKINRTKLLNSFDYIVFGDTSLGLEFAIKKYNIFRIYDKQFIPTFDIDKEIPTATNSKTISKLLRKKNIPQKSSLIEKNYFFKYDKKASYRFHKVIDNL